MFIDIHIYIYILANSKDTLFNGIRLQASLKNIVIYLQHGWLDQRIFQALCANMRLENVKKKNKRTVFI